MEKMRGVFITERERERVKTCEGEGGVHNGTREGESKVVPVK